MDSTELHKLELVRTTIEILVSLLPNMLGKVKCALEGMCPLSLSPLLNSH